MLIFILLIHIKIYIQKKTLYIQKEKEKKKIYF